MKESEKSAGWIMVATKPVEHLGKGTVRRRAASSPSLTPSPRGGGGGGGSKRIKFHLSDGKREREREREGGRGKGQSRGDELSRPSLEASKIREKSAQPESQPPPVTE